MTETALEIIGSGKRRVEPGTQYGFKPEDGVWKVKRGKIGWLSNVAQPKEDGIEAVKVANQLGDFKEYWLSVFKQPKEGEFRPSKEMVREMFERAQGLENGLNEILNRNPEAFKAWEEKLFGKGGRRKAAMEAMVLEKERANTIWERAIEQIDGKRERSEYHYGNPKKEGGSWVLDGLRRLNMIVNTERVDLSWFANSVEKHSGNYREFGKFVRENEQIWDKS